MTREKKITATADELAEYLFERKDKLPTVAKGYSGSSLAQQPLYL